MEAKIVRVHLIITGQVQAVFYRIWCKKEAENLGLTGWVKNLPAQAGFDDGRVEAVVEGEKDKVEKMIEECKKGPNYAQVKDVVIMWKKEFKNLSEFKILY